MDQLISDGRRIQQWLHARSRLPIHQDFHGIAREVDGEIVAAFGYDNFQDWSCTLHTSTDSPTGYSRALLHQAFRVPFEQWGYRCLLAIIQVSNVRSMHLADRLGFTEIARVPEAHPDGGLAFWKMNKEDCRWLSLGSREEQNVRRQQRSFGPVAGPTGRTG